MNRSDHLENAFAPAPEPFKARMAYTLANMEELTMKRKSHLTIIAVAAVLILLAGVALAAAGFGVLDFLAYEDRDGNKIVNEDIRPLLQRIDKTSDGEAAKLTIHDAACDGTTLSLAWTLENLSDEDVYIIWRPIVNQGETGLAGGTSTNYEFSLGKGEVREGGFSLNMDPTITGDSVAVDLKFNILKARAEVSRYDGLRIEEMTEEEQAAYLESQADDLANGKLVLDSDMPLLPEGEYSFDELMEDALVRLGLVEQLDVFDVPLALAVTSRETDLLPLAQATEIDLGDYRMVLAEGKGSTTALFYTVDYVFETEDAARAFAKARAALALWPITDEEIPWFSGAGCTDSEITENPDGAWSVRYHANITGIWKMPEQVKITAHNVMTSEVYPGEEFILDLTK